MSKICFRFFPSDFSLKIKSLDQILLFNEQNFEILTRPEAIEANEVVKKSI